MLSGTDEEDFPLTMSSRIYAELRKQEKKIWKQVDKFINDIEKAHKRAGKSKLKFD